MSEVSNQAKLYYIKLMFYAHNGFVANPMDVLDSLDYDKGVYMELLEKGEILTLPDRKEIFITSYFVHNYGLKPLSWLSTPYAVYWKGKLFIKKNGIATFKPQEEEGKDPFSAIEEPKAEPEPEKPKQWDAILDELDELHKKII